MTDATALARFRENPEAYRLRYRKHLVPPAPSDKMAAGSALHVALDLWFRETTSNLAAPKAAITTAIGADELTVTARPSPASHLERVLDEYAKRWPRERDPFAVVRNESYVEAQIVTDEGTFDYCGILDRKIRMPDGSEYVMDTKSTGSYLNKSYFEVFELADQMVGYVALERASGRRCDGFFVDAIHLNHKTGGVRAEDFVRHGPILVPDWRVERWAQDVAYDLGEIARLDAERGAERPWPLRQNWRFGKLDEYADFYRYPIELHEQLAKQFEVREWVPKDVADERMRAKLVAKIAQ